MEKRQARLTQARVEIDASRRASGSSNEKPVLLWDEAMKCYYETTIEDIVALVMRKMDERFKTLTEKNDVFLANVREEQSKFVSDTARSIDALIALVESSSPNGGKKE